MVTTAQGIDKGIDDAIREALEITISPEFPTTAGRSLLPVDDFPIHVFPEAARVYFVEQAAALAVPVELVAGPALAAIGALIGRALAIEEKYNRLHYAALWIACIAEPGVGKSAGLEAAFDPLYILQSAAVKRYKDALKDYETRLASWNKDRSGPKPDEPILEHIIVSDFTPEALSKLIEHEPGLIAAIDEFSSVSSRQNQYRAGGKGSDRQHLITLWTCGMLKIDRKHGPPTIVERPVIGFAGGLQPATVESIIDGRYDGYSDRFLTCWPDAQPQPYSAATVSPQVLDSYRGLFNTIYHEIRKRFDGETGVVKVSPEGIAKFRDWFDKNQQAILEASQALKGMYAKLPQHLMRIALVLHVLRHPRRPVESSVTVNTIESAIALVEYFASSNRRAVAYVGNDTTERSVGLAMRVYRRIDDHGDWVSMTDIHRLFKNNLHKDKARAAVDELEAEGKLVRRRVSPNGREIDQWRSAVAGVYEERIRTNLDETKANDEVPPPDEPDDDVEPTLGDLRTASYPETIGIPPGCLGPQICAVKGVCGRASCQVDVVDASDQEVA